MSSWVRSERVVRSTEFIVKAEEPYGACHNEVLLAIGKARDELQLAKRDAVQRGSISSVRVFDDEIRVHCRDDEIVVAIVTYDGPVRDGIR